MQEFIQVVASKIHPAVHLEKLGKLAIFLKAATAKATIATTTISNTAVMSIHSKESAHIQ